MEEYDFIVVGGGTAGCVLASRLSADMTTRVLLLEAGEADGPPEMSDPTLWPMLAGTRVDWAFSTTPQTYADGDVHPVPRGKVLGGSSSINAVTHERGHALSYDAWESAGAAGWNYQTMLPFLKRSETAPGRDPAYRGTDGPMRVAPSVDPDPLFDAFMAAALEAGHPYVDDYNGADGEGAGWSETNVVEGRRQSAADAYLRPVLDRRNLTVVTSAMARRLIIDGGQCQGVVYRKDGQERTVYAEGEVILAAGTIGSAQLLMVSGVGPAEHLRHVGVTVKADLPGVGENLHDHTLTPVAYTASRPVRKAFFRKPTVRFSSGLSDQPDLEILFLDFPLHPRWRPGAENGYSVVFALLTPSSRGSLRLASPDPGIAPLIDPNYLSDGRDLDRQVIGLQRARELGETSALDDWRGRAVAPGNAVSSETDARKYIRGSLAPYNHAVGTCRIGTDNYAVVDPRLCVHGISGLRVADASVMRSIVSGTTNATVLAIAERAAALALEE